MEFHKPVLVFRGVNINIIKDFTWKFCIYESAAMVCRILEMADYKKFKTYLGLLAVPFGFATIVLGYKKNLLADLYDGVKDGSLSEHDIHLPVFSKRNQQYMKVVVPLYGGDWFETTHL